MSFMDHIRACNDHDLSGFKPFSIAGERVGWLRQPTLDLLDNLSGFDVASDGAHLKGETFEERSAYLAEAAVGFVEAGFSRRIRGELFPVTNDWSAPPLATVDRGSAAVFGIRSYGVHMNGWRREPDGEISLWLGRRAKNKPVAGGKLDNMVAGGQPYGLGLMENIIKEADEEAGVPAALAMQAKPVGCLSYVMEMKEGLRPDILFLYDLELPTDFQPQNQDGEMEAFALLPAHEAGRIVATSDDFKFNVNLVIIDFLMRHGLITPDDEPDYMAIAAGLHRGG